MHHLLPHLIRRGVEHLTARQQYIAQLQQDAQAYEDAGKGMEVKWWEVLSPLFVALVGFLTLWSVDYTIGQVMSALAMIESSSSTTAIIESKPAPPPPYSDEAPEKDLLLPEEPIEPTDVEVTLIEHTPITAKISTTIAHLQRIGGFRSRWRGLRAYYCYSILHGYFSFALAYVLDLDLPGSTLVYIAMSALLAPLHMAWTHAMVAYPNSKRWVPAHSPRKVYKPLLLPAVVNAAAEQANILLPIGVAFALGVVGPHAHETREAVVQSGCPKAMMQLALRYLAVPTTYAIIGLAVRFPASVALTRIEALLLPEGEEPIVPFDKAAVMGDVDLSARHGCRNLFVQAWRSFDRASRWRLVKLYVKLFFIQVIVALAFVHLVLIDIYVLGAERLPTFFRSARAQLKLMVIESQNTGVEIPTELN